MHPKSVVQTEKRLRNGILKISVFPCFTSKVNEQSFSFGVVLLRVLRFFPTLPSLGGGTPLDMAKTNNHEIKRVTEMDKKMSFLLVCIFQTG